MLEKRPTGRMTWAGERAWLKKWKIIDGTRVLVKSGSGFVNQEPYNEVIATELHRRLLEPGTYVEYLLIEEDRRIYSACNNMLREDEELVSAYDLIWRRKQRNSESDLMFDLRCRDELGLRNAMDGLSRMFAFEAIVRRVRRLADDLVMASHR